MWGLCPVYSSKRENMHSVWSPKPFLSDSKLNICWKLQINVSKFKQSDTSVSLFQVTINCSITKKFVKGHPWVLINLWFSTEHIINKPSRSASVWAIKGIFIVLIIVYTPHFSCSDHLLFTLTGMSSIISIKGTTEFWHPVETSDMVYPHFKCESHDSELVHGLCRTVFVRSWNIDCWGFRRTSDTAEKSWINLQVLIFWTLSTLPLPV